MSEDERRYSIKGDQTMSKGFIAQYAAEAALTAPGVYALDTGLVASLKEAIGLEHSGKGVSVAFRREDADDVVITVYPVVEFGYVIPEVAWMLQERVKRNVEAYTGLNVDAVHVHVVGVVTCSVSDEVEDDWAPDSVAGVKETVYE